MVAVAVHRSSAQNPVGRSKIRSSQPCRVQQEVNMRTFEDRVFLALVIAVSLAFGWILWPFYGAILWGVVAAIVFAPLYRRLSQAMQQRHSLAAVATVMIIVTIVILPLTLIGAALAREASGVYERVQIRRTESRSFIPADSGRSSSLGNQSARSPRPWQPGRGTGESV